MLYCLPSWSQFAIVDYQITDQLPVAHGLLLVTHEDRPTAYVPLARCAGISACTKRYLLVGVWRSLGLPQVPIKV